MPCRRFSFADFAIVGVLLTLFTNSPQCPKRLDGGAEVSAQVHSNRLVGPERAQSNPPEVFFFWLVESERPFVLTHVLFFPPPTVVQ